MRVFMHVCPQLDKDGDAAAASVSARVSASAGLAPASASAPTSVLGAAAEFGQDLGGGMAATGFQTAGGRVVAVSAQALKRRAEFMAKVGGRSGRRGWGPRCGWGPGSWGPWVVARRGVAVGSVAMLQGAAMCVWGGGPGRSRSTYR